MTLRGAGTMPAGTGPAGLWYDDDPPSGRPDPSNLSLAYDAVTRGYTYDSTTRQLTQMSGVCQRVALTLITLLESSSTLHDWGLQRPTKHHAGFTIERETAVRNALRAMVEVEKVIRIEAIETEVDGSRSLTSVTFWNLSTGQREKATV